MPTNAEITEVRLLLRHFATHRTRWIAALCRHVGISRSDYDAFEALEERGPLTPSELGAVLSLSSGAVTALIDRLEHLGWAEREGHPEDRRSVVVVLTKKAWRTRQQELKPYLEAVDDATRALSRDERKIVARFLEAVVEQVQQAPRPK